MKYVVQDEENLKHLFHFKNMYMLLSAHIFWHSYTNIYIINLQFCKAIIQKI